MKIKPNHQEHLEDIHEYIEEHQEQIEDQENKRRSSNKFNQKSVFNRKI